jgi:hypothetical protein
MSTVDPIIPSTALPLGICLIRFTLAPNMETRGRIPGFVRDLKSDSTLFVSKYVGGVARNISGFRHFPIVSVIMFVFLIFLDFCLPVWLVISRMCRPSTVGVKLAPVNGNGLRLTALRPLRRWENYQRLERDYSLPI